VIPSDPARLVTFRVSGDLYAVDVTCVERVVRYTPARAVPQLPSWIDGVVEYDGRIVPVVDLRRRLSTTSEPVGTRTRMLLLHVEGDLCASVVDQVLDVRAYDEASLAPAPALVRGRAGEFVRGVVSREGALVLVLDLAGLLTAEERRGLATVDAAHD
jgi:purine-binding chemotaxis protein CheW